MMRCRFLQLIFYSKVILLNLSTFIAEVTADMEAGSYDSDSIPKGEKAKYGTAEFLIELENRRSIKVSVWSVTARLSPIIRNLTSRI